MSEEICLACHKEWSKFYKDHTCDEITKLKKALEISNSYLMLIKASYGDSDLMDQYAESAIKEIKEIMEG